MGGGAAVSGTNAHYLQFIDPNRSLLKSYRIWLLNAWIVLFLITSMTNGYDGSMMNGLQSLKQWEEAFHYPAGGKLGLLSAIQNIGSLASYPITPYLTDGIGRRRTIYIGACIMIVATVLQTASQSVNMFIGSRFLVGFGLSLAANAAPLLITELAYPTQRAVLTSCYNTLWMAGSIVAAWTTFGTFNIQNSWAWRVPSAIQGAPSIIQFIFLWFAPESPRWLISKGKDAEALRTLAYYHADGNENDPLIEYEFEEIKAALSLEREIASKVGWFDLVKTPGNRKRMRIIVALAFFSQWTGVGLISYYLNKVLDSIGITDGNTQLLINGILSIWAWITALTGAFLTDRAGRRPLFITSTIGMWCFWVAETTCVAVYTSKGYKGAAHAMIAMIFLFQAFYSAAFSPLIVSYTVEILPYHLRAKGFTVYNFFISVALIFNQYVNPIALAHIGWKYYIVYIAWLAFVGVYCYLFVIETKNRTLEETAALFDGEEKVVELETTAQHAAVDVADNIVDEKEKESQIEDVQS